jgi:hypothetical protein
MKTFVHFLITLLLAAMASVQSAHAATITVINTADSGPGSLRAALAAAVDGDTINFAVTTPATITLTSGELVVNKSVTISGPGANLLSVDANHASGVFAIYASGKIVSISGLTITNGDPFFVHGGGGIYNAGATLTINNCTVSGNSSDSFPGGGIWNDGVNQAPGAMTINNSIISGNSATGIYNSYAPLTINNCTVSGNSDGAIFNDAAEDVPGLATITINNSTISGNSALHGAGISNVAADPGSATLTINNSTLSGNSASLNGGQGGGIYNAGTPGFFGPGNATLTIKNCTFSGNSGAFHGGIFNTGSGATLTIGSTILKAGTSGDNLFNLGGATATSLGYNLSSDDASTSLNQSTDQNNTDPMLGPLQDNGGQTFTQALLVGSPAIDKGKNFSGSTTDQRGTGFARTVDNPSIANATGGDGTDIGAFEVQAATYAAQIQQPINADGSSVFNVKRGVVPVKFTLTLNGTPTCALPPATIAVYRTGTGGNQSIDESIYTGPADNGSNFRIDSCQYVYNLSASPLGVGTYEVDILINNQVVGSASFKLK